MLDIIKLRIGRHFSFVPWLNQQALRICFFGVVICASCLNCIVERLQFAKWYILNITMSILSREEGVRTLGMVWAPGTSLSLHPSALRPEILQALCCSELFQMWRISLLILL